MEQSSGKTNRQSSLEKRFDLLTRQSYQQNKRFEKLSETFGSQILSYNEITEQSGTRQTYKWTRISDECLDAAAGIKLPSK